MLFDRKKREYLIRMAGGKKKNWIITRSRSDFSDDIISIEEHDPNVVRKYYHDHAFPCDLVKGCKMKKCNGRCELEEIRFDVKGNCLDQTGGE